MTTGISLHSSITLQQEHLNSRVTNQSPHSVRESPLWSACPFNHHPSLLSLSPSSLPRVDSGLLLFPQQARYAPTLPPKVLAPTLPPEVLPLLLSKPRRLLPQLTSHPPNFKSPPRCLLSKAIPRSSQLASPHYHSLFFLELISTRQDVPILIYLCPAEYITCKTSDVIYLLLDSLSQNRTQLIEGTQ